MSDIAIRVENLSKRYRIGTKEKQHDTFSGALLHQLRHPMGNLRRLRRLSKFSKNGQGQTNEEDILWALRDVSFEVKRGEVVGVIGRNGAGKSTLLKILSRITHPTHGRMELYGRVSSLLEVGTGFHPELTGRENVYLNGTILGMRKAEIDRKFDEIVDFSGVEKFIDTPVKRYSSGMRVRLAFSVAAHLEPEILLIDEVLAVGDKAFQEKSLGKMDNIARSGRTVLFVSHNMAAVRSLCKKGILLQHGVAIANGHIAEVIQTYQRSFEQRTLRDKKALVQFHEAIVSSHYDKPVHMDEGIQIECELYIGVPLSGFRLFCIIQDDGGQIIVHARVDDTILPGLGSVGKHTISIQLPPLWLKPGIYAFYFKLMANSIELGKGRFVSDSYPLDVSGSVPSEMLLGTLVPSTQWSMVSAQHMEDSIS